MKRIIFMGTPDFSVPILEKLCESKEYKVIHVVTQPDRPKGRKRILTPPPVKVKAQEYNIPVSQPENLSEDYGYLIDLKPDLIITAAYGQLLPNPLLEAPVYNSINVHASLLPELRGGAPIHYAILQGKKETGITIMYMVEKLDSGDIISQSKVGIDDTDTVGTLHDKLSDLGAQLLVETLSDLFAKRITPQAQDDKQSTYAPNITREQEKVHWENDHITIFNQIRGLNPWPVAYTTYKGQVMKLWQSDLDNSTYDQAPGEIVRVDDDSITVVCGNNKAIKLTEIQPAGSKKMKVSDFLRGAAHVEAGEIMGE